MKSPTIEELIKVAEEKEVSTEWDRKKELLKRFNGLSRSTLDNYQSEMESIPEFAEGVIKPGHSTTFINIHIFVWYLRWKEANRYVSKKLSPKEILEKPNRCLEEEAV